MPDNFEQIKESDDFHSLYLNVALDYLENWIKQESKNYNLTLVEAYYNPDRGYLIITGGLSTEEKNTLQKTVNEAPIDVVAEII